MPSERLFGRALFLVNDRRVALKGSDINRIRSPKRMQDDRKQVLDRIAESFAVCGQKTFALRFAVSVATFLRTAVRPRSQERALRDGAVRKNWSSQGFSAYP